MSEKKDTILTPDDLEKIAEAMEENYEESPDLKVLANLPSNNGVEVNENPQEGFEKTVKVAIDPETGIARPTNEEDDDVEGLGDDDISFDEMIERASKNLEDDNIEITEEDIEKQVKTDEMLDGLDDLSREDIVQILRVTQRYQNKEKFNIYRELPEPVRAKINQFIGAGDNIFTVEANTMRNEIAELLIHDFITNISMEKFSMDYQREFEQLQNKMNEEISKMWMDYSKNRTKYIEAAMEHEDDPAKKEVIGAVLDAINDGFTLNRVKLVARAHKIRIKKIELEKPAKAFDLIMNKYLNSTQNIYSIYTAYNILYRHMKDELEDQNDILRFFIAICKVCRNYRVDNPVEHAFMYYAIYNPVLLDVYKGEEYEQFSTEYKKTVYEIIDLIKNKPVPIVEEKKEEAV